jgi:hypothetical protein
LTDYLKEKGILKLMKYFRIILWISFACKSSNIPLKKKKKEVQKQVTSKLVSSASVGPKGFLHERRLSQTCMGNCFLLIKESSFYVTLELH